MGVVQTFAPEHIMEYVKQAGELFKIMQEERERMKQIEMSKKLCSQLAGQLYIEENIITGKNILKKLYGLKKVMKEVISMTCLERKRTFGYIGSPNLEKEKCEYDNLREKIEEWNQKLIKYQIYAFCWGNEISSKDISLFPTKERKIVVKKDLPEKKIFSKKYNKIRKQKSPNSKIEYLI
jgi:hypothetical protein